jgi:phosphate transport system substrate-binding protein
VKEFVHFYLNNAVRILPEVKYVPLTSNLYQLSLRNLQQQKLGTVFGGHSEVGLSIAELMKKERKLENRLQKYCLLVSL